MQGKLARSQIGVELFTICSPESPIFGYNKIKSIFALFRHGRQGRQPMRTNPVPNRYPMFFARFVFAEMFRHGRQGRQPMRTNPVLNRYPMFFARFVFADMPDVGRPYGRCSGFCRTMASPGGKLSSVSETEEERRYLRHRQMPVTTQSSLDFRPHSSSDPAYAGPPSPRGKVWVRRNL